MGATQNPPKNEPPFVLYVADSADSNPLVARATAASVHQLVAALDTASLRATLHPESRDSTLPQVTTPVVADPNNHLLPSRPDFIGEVWAQYVVGIDGLPELATFVAIYCDRAELTAAVRRSLATFRFRPALINGVPV